jgi:hypothetical protein
MNEIKIVNCPVCSSKNNVSYITTNALMHELNNERYEFKKCVLCQVFSYQTPSRSDLNNYYTNNYLPYKGAAAWEIQVICYKSQQNLDLKE